MSVISKFIISGETIDVKDSTARESISNLAEVASTGSYNDLIDKPVIPPGSVVDSELSTTSTNPVQNKVITNRINSISNDVTTLSDSISTVGYSGSYNDLTNKPTIPSQVTESTVSGWGFTKNVGTVTSIKVNGTSKTPTSGVVDIGTVPTIIYSSSTETITIS